MSCFNIAIVYIKTTQYPANLNKCLQQEYHLNIRTIIYFNCEERYEVLIHIFSCILHYLRVCYEVLKWSAPSWLDSLLGRALHRSSITEVMGWILCKPGCSFFSGFTVISQLLELCVKLWWSILSSYSSFYVVLTVPYRLHLAVH